jgi:arginine/lysine/ornithine decarboxylase
MLLVDNAHGAYLAFTEPSAHPIHLGADMCCDSAHKTLPVLTGGAYLHIGKRFGVTDKEVRSALSLFASTSPSYLILKSLDLCNKYLSSDYKNKLDEHIKKLKLIKEKLAILGFDTEDCEPLKLVFSRASCGYGGDELADHLRANMIEPEFFDRDTLVLMSSPMNTDEELERLVNALSKLPKRSPEKNAHPPHPETLISRISPREAMLSASETVQTKNVLGRICASPTVSCPPAVPIVMSGELISERAVELMLYYGIDEIEVIQ